MGQFNFGLKTDESKFVHLINYLLILKNLSATPQNARSSYLQTIIPIKETQFLVYSEEKFIP